MCQQPMADSRRTAIAHRLFALWGKTVDLPMSHVQGALFTAGNFASYAFPCTPYMYACVLSLHPPSCVSTVPVVVRLAEMANLREHCT